MNVGQIRAGAGEGEKFQPALLAVGPERFEQDAARGSGHLHLGTGQPERLGQPDGLGTAMLEELCLGKYGHVATSSYDDGRVKPPFTPPAAPGP